LQTTGQEKMTTNNSIDNGNTCPAQELLKTLSGKWKPQIFFYAVQGPVRFSSLLRDIQGANKQTLSVALRELEEADLLIKNIVSEKPLHIAYSLSEKGHSLIPIFRQLELLS
jgi:DNA-binding HxlR family transcriptional regulator